jgi:hypothetical protein
MNINFKRGLFRGWLVLSIAWIGFAGWNEYHEAPWNLNWPLARPEGPCWDSIAIWPNGEHFYWADISEEEDTPLNIEIDKFKHEWSADSIPTRNQFRETVVQKLNECEAAAIAATPLVQRASQGVVRVWETLGDAYSLRAMLLPPLALLLAGWIAGWIIRGFRASA